MCSTDFYIHTYIYIYTKSIDAVSSLWVDEQTASVAVDT